MIIRAALLLYCFLVMGAVHLSGQVPARAQNFLNEGLRYQTKRQPAKAEAAFKNAIKAHPAFIVHWAAGISTGTNTRRPRPFSCKPKKPVLMAPRFLQRPSPKVLFTAATSRQPYNASPQTAQIKSGDSCLTRPVLCKALSTGR
jgi:hypothetical protein